MYTEDSTITFFKISLYNFLISCISFLNRSADVFHIYKMIPRIDITADVTRKASSHAWSSRAETLSTDITSCSLFELQDKPQHFSTYLDTKHNNDDHQLWNKSLFAQDEENRSQTSTFSDFEDLTQTAATMNSSRSSISSESKLNKSQNNRQQTHANDVPYHILRRSQKQM